MSENPAIPVVIDDSAPKTLSPTRHLHHAVSHSHAYHYILAGLSDHRTFRSGIIDTNVLVPSIYSFTPLAKFTI